jgi:peptide/nickel transport system ATP-binding protein
VGIARALAVGPRLIVCDEAVSALDVSVRAQILNLFVELRERLGLAYLFVSHDLGVIRFVSHRVAVMYLGTLVEVAPTAALFKEPLHPYTQGLLRSIPRIDLAATARRRLETIPGTVPTLRGDIAPGCRFAPRCPFVKSVCTEKDPVLKEVKPGHKVSCWLY